MNRENSCNAVNSTLKPMFLTREFMQPGKLTNFKPRSNIFEPLGTNKITTELLREKK